MQVEDYIYREVEELLNTIQMSCLSKDKQAKMEILCDKMKQELYRW